MSFLTRFSRCTEPSAATIFVLSFKFCLIACNS
ncbi:Uncharacterised protein [Vibrio cholerae]|nr:Uncharacterised protein [Vibrio cholerae]